MNRVCVLGAGAWGTAVALLLARNGNAVRLWCFEADGAISMQKTRCNDRYLPGVYLDEHIEVTADLAYAVSGAHLIFEAVPVQFLRSVVERVKAHCQDDQVWVILSKGIENNTLLFPTQIIDDVFKKKMLYVVLSGPSFARDLVNKQVTAVDLSASDGKQGLFVQTTLANSYFRPYLSWDLIGSQIGGAVKNLFAVGVGLLDGAGYTDNTKAFLITGGLQEMVILAQALGGNPQTVYGLSGVGDLVLTTMGSLSRNVAVGRQFSQGKSLAEVTSQMEQVPEGINTIRSVQQLCERKKLQLPICQGIYKVVFEGLSLDAFLHAFGDTYMRI